MQHPQCQDFETQYFCLWPEWLSPALQSDRMGSEKLLQ